VGFTEGRDGEEGAEGVAGHFVIQLERRIEISLVVKVLAVESQIVTSIVLRSSRVTCARDMLGVIGKHSRDRYA
jgi:hypothetical protein